HKKWLHAYFHWALANYERSKSVISKIAGNEKDHVGGSQDAVIPDQYEYVCAQHTEAERHAVKYGGTSYTSGLNDLKSLKLWTLNGQRTWMQIGNKPKVYYKLPYTWKTLRGFIFNDHTYLYTYIIYTDAGPLFGYSNGKCIYS